MNIQADHLWLLAVTVSDLLSGHNVVYVGLFGLGLFFTLMSVLGLGSHTDADLDASGDVDAHVDVHADADVDAAVDVDHHVELDAAGHADAHAEGDGDGDLHANGAGVLQSAASFFGVGRAPLSVIITVFCYSYALIGAATNLSLIPRLGMNGAFSVSLAVGFVGAALITRAVSRLIARFMPTYFSTAQKRTDFVGLRGEVTSAVSDRFGQVFVRDRFGTLNTFNCKSLPGARPITKGTVVVLVKYMPAEDMYVVAPA